jgi:hypothetical protein
MRRVWTALRRVLSPVRRAMVGAKRLSEAPVPPGLQEDIDAVVWANANACDWVVDFRYGGRALVLRRLRRRAAAGGGHGHERGGLRRRLRQPWFQGRDVPGDAPGCRHGAHGCALRRGLLFMADHRDERASRPQLARLHARLAKLRLGRLSPRPRRRRGPEARWADPSRRVPGARNGHAPERLGGPARPAERLGGRRGGRGDRVPGSREGIPELLLPCL